MSIPKNWPTILTGFATVIGPALVHFGVVTPDQLGALGVLLGPVFTWMVHRMPSPAAP